MRNFLHLLIILPGILGLLGSTLGAAGFPIHSHEHHGSAGETVHADHEHCCEHDHQDNPEHRGDQEAGEDHPSPIHSCPPGKHHHHPCSGTCCHAGAFWFVDINHHLQPISFPLSLSLITTESLSLPEPPYLSEDKPPLV